MRLPTFPVRFRCGRSSRSEDRFSAAAARRQSRQPKRSGRAARSLALLRDSGPIPAFPCACDHRGGIRALPRQARPSLSSFYRPGGQVHDPAIACRPRLLRFRTAYRCGLTLKENRTAQAFARPAPAGHLPIAQRAPAVAERKRHLSALNQGFACARLLNGLARELLFQ